jgi:phosphatidylinositol alpha-1,6-mannosyltransferase
LDVASLNIAALRASAGQPPDAILGMHIVVGPGALAAGRLFDRPVVLFAHAQELNRHPRLARATFRRASRIIVVSSQTRALAENLGAPTDRVRVVYPGANAPDQEPAERNGDQPAVVVVARLEERYKGHDVLLRAMVLVRRSFPDARLHVVGDGPLRRELEGMTASLGLSDAVTFHGRLANAQRDAVLTASNVFCMPSRVDEHGAGEGFGIAYIEAGAHGLPVVGGRVAGALDAVIDGETGVLVDPEDPAAVAEALTRLLREPGLARQMGLAGRRRALELSWPRAAAQVESVHDEVLRC